MILLLGVLAPRGLGQASIDPETGLKVFEQLEGWVRDWDVPSVDTPGALSEPLCAAVVTLRLDGYVFGRGAASSPDPDRMLLWRASSEAFNAANSKLTQERDAMWEAFIRQLSERITITLEIGGELVPISPSERMLPGFGYSPGSVGLAVRLGDKNEAIGPESVLTRRGDPARSIVAEALALSDDNSLVLETPDRLSEQGFVFYRWKPMSIAQPAPGLGGVFLDRGGRVIAQDEISVRSIKTMSQRIATHLMNRRWDGVEKYGFVGTLDPVTGKSASAHAAPFEQALGAYALLRYGEDADTAQKREAIEAGRDVLRALGVVETREIAPWDDPIGACMSIVALGEIPLELILGDRDLNELRERSIETLDTLYSSSEGFAEGIPPAAQGLVAHALVASASLDPRDRSSLADDAISRVFLETPSELLVSQMPFLAWAELERAGADGDIASSGALRQMRELVWEHQLKRADLDLIDRDLAGGIVFTRASAPLPSWSCLRPLAAISTMLGDERLTEGSLASGEVPMQIGRLVDSVRFVRQLVSEGETLHMYADAEGADWGVRMALWDQRMPIESSAMALLVLHETLTSFEQISER
jgi:hypothetical protein